MGQISMKLMRLPGSLLSANQQAKGVFACGFFAGMVQIALSEGRGIIVLLGFFRARVFACEISRKDMLRFCAIPIRGDGPKVNLN